MGKYMRRKSKSTNEVSLMEVPSFSGVLTRAKTLALQKAVGGNYIQLRSRRLVKPISPKKDNDTNPSKLRGVNSLRSKHESVVSVVNILKLDDEKDGICEEFEKKDGVNLGIDNECSIGENDLEIQTRGRNTRETTPCSLIRDPNVIKTPGSSTKPTRSIDNEYRMQNATPIHIPSPSEMDEFFTGPEKQQQQKFIEKYNFDPVNDKPLHGRYEWMKIDSTKKS
ncbi:cyclin-dependent kinase inhibitor 4-like [Rutidosis leptorrhynchoides]|uniref:cyclin-dependent kinase inhibitor 4-like n=1 Tax=Rutidosis leptorrhynchoides TaxID=125765 RepID=UPI003A9A1A00